MTRFGYVATTAIGLLTIGGLTLVPITPRLIWNDSASVPIGLYSVAPVERLALLDLVAIEAPEPLSHFLADGGHLPRGVPLLKRVVGLPGQEACRIDDVVTVDGVAMAHALDRDRRGRPLPIWRGCQRIADHEVFLMNPQVRDSLDSRYFGPIDARSIIGRATPVWTDEDGTGRYRWRAPTR